MSDRRKVLCVGFLVCDIRPRFLVGGVEGFQSVLRTTISTAVIPVLLLVDALALFVLRFDAVRLEDMKWIVLVS